jgi:WD40 repeat protein
MISKKVLLFLVCLNIFCVFGINQACAFEKPEIFVQLGHVGSITSITFSFDGKYILTGSGDKTIKLWDAKTGREIKTLFGHNEGVTSIAISPDGRYIVSGSDDKTIRLWDFEIGKEIGILRGHDDIVTSVAISPNGRYIASGSYDKTIKIWDLISGVVLRTLRGHVNFVNSVTFSPSGRYLLSGGDDDYMKRTWSDVFILWDVKTGEKVRSFKGNLRYGDVKYVGFISDRYAYSCSDTIRIWDLETGQEIKGLGSQETHSFLYSVAASPDGKYIIAGGTGKLFLWNVKSGELIKTYSGNFGTINSVAFSQNSRNIIFGDMGGGIRIWDIMEDREINSFGRAVPSVFSVDFSPDNRFFISGSTDTTSKLWNIKTGEMVKIFKGHKDWVLSTAFHPSGNYFLSSSGSFFDNIKDMTIKLWDVREGKEIKTFIGHTGIVRKVVFSPDGQYGISAGWDGTLKIWDTAISDKGIPVGEVESGSPAERAGILKGDFINAIDNLPIYSWSDFVDTIKNNPNRKIVFTLKRKERTLNVEVIPIAVNIEGKIVGRVGIRLGDMSSKTFRGHNSRFINSVAASPDGKFAVSGSGDKTVRLWDIEKGTELKTFTEDADITSVSFSPNGKYFLSGSIKSLTLWDIESGRKIKKLTGHNDWIYATAFSPDGKYIASGSYDGIIKLWDAESGYEINTLRGHNGGVESVCFSSDGNYLLSGSGDGTIRQWDIKTGKEIAQFISFTDGEWIVITPEGYFNASPNGAKHLNVRVGNNVYSIDNFYEKFFNPVYVASVLQGKKVEAVADIRKGFLTPPEVKIISPEPNKEFSTDTITITVSAKDTGGGIDEIRLYHNGKAVGEDTRGIKIVPKGNETIKTYTVTLVDGINTFRATAFSKDRTESNPYELIVKLTAPQKEVSLYVLAVGINKYKNPALNLNYAVPDAKGITEFFRDQGKELFKEVEFIEIYDDRATREAIVSKLRELQNTNPQDAVLIYLAGHGENIDDKWYFIPHELTYPEREDEVKAKGLSSDELSGLVKNIKAQKILILIDACKSGAALVAFRGFEDRKALTQLSRATGVHVIAASTKDQFASEVKDLGHGVFTYTLLDGLKGKAAGKGETITVRKLMGYIEERLPDITKKYKQEAQYPVVDSRGMDFPLVLIK